MLHLVWFYGIIGISKVVNILNVKGLYIEKYMQLKGINIFMHVHSMWVGAQRQKGRERDRNEKGHSFPYDLTVHVFRKKMLRFEWTKILQDLEP